MKTPDLAMQHIDDTENEPKKRRRMAKKEKWKNKKHCKSYLQAIFSDFFFTGSCVFSLTFTNSCFRKNIKIKSSINIIKAFKIKKMQFRTHSNNMINFTMR